MPKLDLQDEPTVSVRVLRPMSDERGAALRLKELRPKRAKHGLASSPKSRERTLRPRESAGRPKIAEKGAG
jgi:hypothetical protein